MFTAEYMKFAEEVKQLRPTMTVKELALHFHITEKEMSRELRDLGLTKPSNRVDISDEAVLEEYQAGRSVNDIARRFGTSHETIKKRLTKYGISVLRAEGIRRHFSDTYEQRWVMIKQDLDKGLSVSFLRNKYHIRMDNLKKLMKEHGYQYKTNSMLEHLRYRLSNEDGNVLQYLNVIYTYIMQYDELPNPFVLSDLLYVSIASVRQKIREYQLQEFMHRNQISSWVSYLMSFLNEQGVSYQLNNRKLLKETADSYGKELDFYLPDFHIGIEVNPFGTHSVDVGCVGYGLDDIYYHQKKSLLAERCGVPLIHMYDFDFSDDVQFHRIMNRLFVTDKMHVGARSCDLREISRSEAFQFLEVYHLQGGEKQSKYRYGLYFQDVLCCVLTLGKSRYTKDDFEIIRYCVRPDYAVSGGFQRMFHHFTRTQPKGVRVVSYLDLNKRFTVDNIYEKSGFVYDGLTSPDYVWIEKKTGVVLKRYQTTKKKLVAEGYDPSKTEKEIMISRNYCRVFGAGAKRYVYVV